MLFSALFFYFFAGLALVFALATIFNKNAVGSALSLVGVLFSFAGIYALLSAHLIAALQILIYAGAIMVLFLFVIMLLNSDHPTSDILEKSGLFQWIAVSIFGAFIGLMVFLFRHLIDSNGKGSFNATMIHQKGGHTQFLSELLFSEAVLPFELTSVLLLVAIVGSVVIAKRKNLKRRS